MTQDRAAFAGQIADVPVVELLQTILQGRHTGVARFDTPSGAATLWFRDGALVDADMGRHHMEAAVQRLLALEDGAFEIEFKPINRRQVIKLGTADLIAQAPSHANEDTDARSKRGRRQGVSWHPTGGGRGRSLDASSGAVPIVAAPETASQPIATSGAVPVVVPPVSSGAVPIVPMPPSASAPIATLPMTVLTASGTAVPIAAPPSASAPIAITPAPSNGAATPTHEPEPPTRGRTMFGVPAIASTPLPPPSVPTNGAASPNASDASQTAMSPSSTMVGAARLGLEATIPPLVASAAARRLEGARDEVVLEIPDVEDRTWMRPFAPPVTQAVPGDPTPLPRVPPEPGRPTTPSHGKTPVPVAVPAEPVRAPDATMRPKEPPRGVTAMFFPPPRALGPAPSPAAEWPELPETTERTSPAPVDEEDKTVREESRPSRGTIVGPAVVSGGPSQSPTPTWEPPSDRTMTAGSLVRSPAAAVARPGGARRGDERVADIAHAIGLQPLPAVLQDPRAVADGVRLDQQVEAARAAGLTGASAPALVGRYEVLLRIARGGMGTVYLARITGEGGFRRLFALKVIRDHLSQNDEYVRMLLQEARIASRLHHPNVVGIVDIGTLANQHYLVMDYVEGCTFSELLKVHRRTRPAHLIVPIVLDALTGLHAAHTLVDDDGVPLTLVHCDFSPQNMLLGTNGICRITDFGIARATTAWNERSSITRGKPAYVSPEQVIGRPLDRRSDVFSAGVVLWNALTGEQLFDGDSPERTLNAVLNKPIAPPSTVGLRPPSCFDRVCLRALQRDPDRRYQSAEEMLIELRRIAIAEDYLAPSSEVAQWVIDTFGRQLELRRQAAGISNRGLNDSQPVLAALAVPELSFLPVRSAEQTAETNVLPGDYPSNPSYGTTPIDDSHPSRTALMRADVAYDAPAPLATSRARAFVLGIAVTIATTAIAVAIARPDWIGGGAVDDYGRYVAPADGGSETPPPPKDDPGKPELAPSDAKIDAKADAKAEGKIEPAPPEPPPAGEIAVPEPLPEIVPPVAEKRPRKPPREAKATDGERRLEKKKTPPEETPPAETKSDDEPPTPDPTKAPPPPPTPKHSPPVDPFETSKPAPE
jgi:eukaryotic-like serine/threonine-protein kinase